MGKRVGWFTNMEYTCTSERYKAKQKTTFDSWAHHAVTQLYEMCLKTNGGMQKMEHHIHVSLINPSKYNYFITNKCHNILSFHVNVMISNNHKYLP